MRSMTALGVVLVCGAASGATIPNAEPIMVPMTAVAVGIYEGQPVVLLEDAEHKRRLTIWIGESEANAIDMRLHGRKAPRPLTHDLLERTLTAVGAHVDRVEIVDLRDSTYIGRLTLRDKAGTLHAIDSRPSDDIALAVGAGLPIYVHPKVLAEAATEVGSAP
jgi:bifunctional DNase/RNase